MSRKTVSRKRKIIDETFDIKSEVPTSIESNATDGNVDIKTELVSPNAKKSRNHAKDKNPAVSTKRNNRSSNKVKTKGNKQAGAKVTALKLEDDSEQNTDRKPKKVSIQSNDTKSKTQFIHPDSLVPLGVKFVGAHVSGAGGLENAVHEAFSIGARAFGLFLRNQRQWASKPLTDDTVLKFNEAMKKYGYSHDMVLPHASYLLNCGSPDDGNLKKSRDLLIDELKRCEMLGLRLYNIHPGSSNGLISVDDCLSRIADSINLALSETRGVTVVIENMSCQGNTVGGKFEELRGIIDRVKDKSRIGVCLDTCHAFAAGYDVKNQKGYEETMQQFDSVVGLQYLKAMHINDSKGELGCHLDRHENIGQGKIGLDAFKYLMNDARLNNIPFVVETPAADYTKEIDKLYSLVQKK